MVTFIAAETRKLTLTKPVPFRKVEQLHVKLLLIVLQTKTFYHYAKDTNKDKWKRISKIFGKNISVYTRHGLVSQIFILGLRKVFARLKPGDDCSSVEPVYTEQGFVQVSNTEHEPHLLRRQPSNHSITELTKTYQTEHRNCAAVHGVPNYFQTLCHLAGAIIF